MGHTRENAFQLNWGAALNSNPYNPNLALSGVLSGVMTGTNTIYSNVLPIPQMHNVGLEITWTGTPTGTISLLVSISGINFYPLTFSPALGQPAGAGGGYVVDMNQLPFKFFAIQYINASGVGALTAYAQQKDLG